VEVSETIKRMVKSLKFECANSTCDLTFKSDELAKHEFECYAGSSRNNRVRCLVCNSTELLNA